VLSPLTGQLHTTEFQATKVGRRSLTGRTELTKCGPHQRLSHYRAVSGLAEAPRLLEDRESSVLSFTAKGTILREVTMHCNGRSGFRETVHFVACLCSILMLLTFPGIRMHQPAEHLRMPGIRGSTAQHTSLDRTTADTSERISVDHRYLSALFVKSEEPTKARENIDPTPSVPIVRLLLRLKVGPSPSALSDPLL
jgi:hypothetical protein